MPHPSLADIQAHNACIYPRWHVRYVMRTFVRNAYIQLHAAPSLMAQAFRRFSNQTGRWEVHHGGDP